MHDLITPGVRWKLLEYATSITKSADAAEMILADTIAIVLEKADLSRIKTFLAYLKICLRHNAFDWVRRDKVRRNYLELKQEQTTRSAFVDVISREAMQFFDGTVRKLPRRERRMLILRVVDGLCFRDIGRKMKMSEVACRAMFWRMKDRLRGFLAYMEAL